MGNPGVRLLLVEFVSPGWYKLAATFPYANGLAFGAGLPVRWLRFGVPPDRRLSHGEEAAGLDGDDVDRLANEVVSFRTDRVVFGQRPEASLVHRLRESAPDVRLAVAAGPDGWEPYIPDGLQRLTNSRADWSRFLGIADPVRGSVFDAKPHFGFVEANSLASLAPNVAYLCLGRHCGYKADVARNPAYAGVDLSGSARTGGCAFCCFPRIETGSRGYTPGNARMQISALARTHPGRQSRLLVRLFGDPWLSHAREVVDLGIASGMSPCDWLFDSRADGLVARRSCIDAACDQVAGTGHRIAISLVGIENFSRPELDRMNKGLGPLDCLDAILALYELERDHPGVFGFADHGGLSTILFTPWTRLQDLALNLAVVRETMIGDVSGKFAGSRLRLMPGLPITALASRDGLIEDRYRDPLLDTSARSLYGAEVPWRFADPLVEPICRILVRFDRANAPWPDPLASRVREILAAEALRGRTPVDVAADLVDEAASDPDPSHPADPGELFDRLSSRCPAPECRDLDLSRVNLLLARSQVLAGLKPVARLEHLSPETIRSLPVDLPNLRLQERDGATEVLFGSDAAQVSRLADLGRILQGESPGEQGFRDAMRQAGDLLGYPRCCVEAYAGLDPAASERQTLLHLALRLQAEEVAPETNPWLFGTVTHVPCTPGCPQTLERMAAGLDRLEADLAPGERARLREASSNPWLVLARPDGTALELIPLDPPGDRFRFRPGFRTRANRALQGAEGADEVIVEPDRLVLLSAGRVVSDLTARAFLWWHRRVFQREWWDRILRIRALALARPGTRSEPAPTEPSSNGGHGIRDLLGDLPGGTISGWRLEQAVARRTIELTFASGDGRCVVWIAPVDADTACYRMTRRFRIGYRGETAAPEVLDLVDRISDRLRAREAGLPESSLGSLFTTVRDTREIRTRDGVLELRVTRRCNESCPFCNSLPYADNQVDGPEMVARAIRAASGSGVLQVVFTGGEPTLEPGLGTWIRLARDLGLRTTVQTNGILPGRLDWWEALRDSEGRPALPDSLLVSWHTRRPARLATLTGVSGTMDAKTAAVRTALNLGLEVSLNLVISTLNLDELAGFPAFVARAFGRRARLVLSVVAPTGRAARRPDLWPDPADLVPRLRRALDSARRHDVSASIPEACGVPICALPDRATSFLAASRTTPIPEALPDHVKPATCRECPLDATCIGIWKAYAERFGTSWLVPVPKSPAVSGRDEP